jgi:PPOX class probable F420-dependent enzyme
MASSATHAFGRTVAAADENAMRAALACTGRRPLRSRANASYDDGVTLPQSVVEFLATGPLAHLVTLDPDGAPHVTVAWVGVEADEVVIGTLSDQPKLRNLRADPRVALSFEAPGRTEYGLAPYLVLRGRARLTEGGAANLLHRLAQIYIGPGTDFPPMPDPPPGFVIRVAVEKISGAGPWTTG